LINPKADHGNKEQQREPKKTLLLTRLWELQIGINKENSIKQSIKQSSNQSIKQASKASKASK
jgi:hypothetical protein